VILVAVAGTMDDDFGRREVFQRAFYDLQQLVVTVPLRLTFLEIERANVRVTQYLLRSPTVSLFIGERVSG
jgi:hypothetical protein